MSAHAPYFRETGSGPGVVCLHANASSSSQWRALMDKLGERYHVLAADSYGAGRSPAWPTGRTIGLRDEAALLEPVFARAGEPFFLVGHSYGAAVALIAALSKPRRIRALALYEPTLFSLVDGHSLLPNDADGIRETAAVAAAALVRGDAVAAAQCFIDFWMGAGSWAAMPEARQTPILSAILNVNGWAHALLREPTPLAAFRALDMPVLYMTGKRSPLSSLAVARLLTPVLPQVKVVEFDDLGHMGPVTHPEVVNAVIAVFLRTV